MKMALKEKHEAELNSLFVRIRNAHTLENPNHETDLYKELLATVERIASDKETEAYKPIEGFDEVYQALNG